MENYIQAIFEDIQPEQQEWVIAHLSEAGYEGFEEGELILKAFIPEKDFDPLLLKELAFKYQLTYSVHLIAARNWNALWESNFQPVLVDDFVLVRAHFHPPLAGVKYDIEITPKMSFGTGHHATTYMMICQMKKIDFTNKTIIDFGTGTGVLAILAEKMGAKKVIAIDNDDWSIENASENINRNHCIRIELNKADTITIKKEADVILANINRNIILENLPALVDALSPNGILILSGLLNEDESAILQAADEESLLFTGKMEKDNWISLSFLYRTEINN